MEQTYLLKEYGALSIVEQCYMSGEERRWYIQRINKEIEKRNKQQSAYSRGGDSQAPPNFPRKPSV